MTDDDILGYWSFLAGEFLCRIDKIQKDSFYTSYRGVYMDCFSDWEIRPCKNLTTIEALKEGHKLDRNTWTKWYYEKEISKLKEFND